jgi:hypothetical protein
MVYSRHGHNKDSYAWPTEEAENYKNKESRGVCLLRRHKIALIWKYIKKLDPSTVLKGKKEGLLDVVSTYWE